MNKNWRFVYQDNMYWGSCEPCTASVFSTKVRLAVVNWKISMRQDIRKAVREGKSLERFTNHSDYQKWCLWQMKQPHANEKFAQLSTAEKLLQWGNVLKDSLPVFIFAVKEFALVPRLNKDKKQMLDENGQPMFYRQRIQKNIVHLSGLFMSPSRRRNYLNSSRSQGTLGKHRWCISPPRARVCVWSVKLFLALATLPTSSICRPKNWVCSM